MKIRNGFISNSSSSSFLIKVDLRNKQILSQIVNAFVHSSKDTLFYGINPFYGLKCDLEVTIKNNISNYKQEKVRLEQSSAFLKKSFKIKNKDVISLYFAFKNISPLMQKKVYEDSYMREFNNRIYFLKKCIEDGKRILDKLSKLNKEDLIVILNESTAWGRIADIKDKIIILLKEEN